jgi:SH3 domain-containing YSC84-like protein 1
MASNKEVVTFSSFPKFNDSIKNNLNSNTDPWSPQVSRNTRIYPAIDSYDSAAEEEEESGTDGWGPLPASGRRPEVNLRNVFLGLIAIVTGKNKAGSSSSKSDNSGISFLGSNPNGDSYLLPSVYLPSAPPLLGEVMNSVGAHKSVLEAEPPEWLPDSSTSFCMQCSAQFAPLTKGRHHCRFCGGVFCRVCTKGRCLLPRKFRVRDPQRVCDGCYDRLDPVQGLLLNQVSNASQTAKHDVLDWTCMRGWLNLPIGMKMEDEIYKATNTLRSFTQVWCLYNILVFRSCCPPISDFDFCLKLTVSI